MIKNKKSSKKNGFNLKSKQKKKGNCQNRKLWNNNSLFKKSW